MPCLQSRGGQAPAGLSGRSGGATLRHSADVAQLVEHFTRNEGVHGSSPRVGSSRFKRFGGRLVESVGATRASTTLRAAHPVRILRGDANNAGGDTRDRGCERRICERRRGNLAVGERRTGCGAPGLPVTRRRTLASASATQTGCTDRAAALLALDQRFRSTGLPTGSEWPFVQKAPVILPARVNVVLAIEPDARTLAAFQHDGHYVSAIRFEACRERVRAFAYRERSGNTPASRSPSPRWIEAHACRWRSGPTGSPLRCGGSSLSVARHAEVLLSPSPSVGVGPSRSRSASVEKARAARS